MNRHCVAQSWRSVSRLLASHVGHGLIALLVVIGLYGGAEVAVPLKQHVFQSHTLVALTEGVGWLPSPFPKQFLVGIDEQQLDLEHGLPTYFMGHWYPRGMWWYYLAGLLAKEQLVFSLGLIAMMFGGVRLWYRTDERTTVVSAPSERERVKGSACTVSAAIATGKSADSDIRQVRACFLFCFMIAVMVLGLLSWHSKMALNVRYAFPALPALYLAIGISVTSLFAGRESWLRRLFLLMLVIVAGELTWSFPHYFAYVNPLFGGSYRVPPVLHDSNFDGGQDLWRLERYLAEHLVPTGVRRYVGIDSRLPTSALRFNSAPPTEEVLKEMLVERKTGVRASMTNSKTEVIVMRGLGMPALWTKMQGCGDPATMALLAELLTYPPDAWITPTLAIYRMPSSSEL